MTKTTAYPIGSLSRSTSFARWRALKAIVKKEWTIFIRYPSWFIALIIWPIIFPLVYVLTGRALAGPSNIGLEVFTQATGITDFLGYISIGTLMWMWQNIVLWDVGFALRRDQMRGTLESNWLSPTWRFAYLLGNSATQLVSMFMLLTVSALEFALFYGVRFHGKPLLIILVILASIPSIYGLGFAFASLVITAKEANAFVYLVRGVVMVFCGVTFPLSVMPGWMQSVAKWLPQSYSINAMRNAALANADFQTLAPDLLALFIFGVFWIGVGYLTFSWMERRARQTGAIGQY